MLENNDNVEDKVIEDSTKPKKTKKSNASAKKKKSKKSTAKKTASKKSNDGRDERGRLVKGHVIGQEHWFTVGNSAARKYTDDLADLMLEYAQAETTIIPSLVGFAKYAKVSPTSLDTWKREFPRFEEACRIMEKIRAEKLTEGGVTRVYEPSMCKFLLSSLHGYSEKTKTEAEVKQEITVTINGIE